MTLLIKRNVTQSLRLTFRIHKSDDPQERGGGIGLNIYIGGFSFSSTPDNLASASMASAGDLVICGDTHCYNQSMRTVERTTASGSKNRRRGLKTKSLSRDLDELSEDIMAICLTINSTALRCVLNCVSALD